MRIRSLVVFALVALAACRGEQERAQRDEALKHTLAEMRRAIAQYKADRGTYPATLDALVPDYIRKVPPDPLTHAVDWRVTTEETVQPSSDFQTTTAAALSSVVIDVHSSAPGTDRNGVPYANY